MLRNDKLHHLWCNESSYDPNTYPPSVLYTIDPSENSRFDDIKPSAPGEFDICGEISPTHCEWYA